MTVNYHKGSLHDVEVFFPPIPVHGKNQLDSSSCFDTIPACDGQTTCNGRTDGRTHDNSEYRASIASRGKNETRKRMFSSGSLHMRINVCKLCCSVHQPSSIRGLATPWSTFSIHPCPLSFWLTLPRSWSQALPATVYLVEGTDRHAHHNTLLPYQGLCCSVL